MIDDAHRDRLRAFASILIPEAHGMPSAGDVGVADGQLDRVLAVRDDLTAPLLRAIAQLDPDDHEGTLERLQRDDAEAHDALLLVIVGGYYIDPDVRRRLGYDGQVPTEVRPEIIPNYVEEGLIEPLLARGPVYRDPAPQGQAPTGAGSSLTTGSSITDDLREETAEMATDDHGTSRA
jgi:hypothetical protein